MEDWVPGRIRTRMPRVMESPRFCHLNYRHIYAQRNCTGHPAEPGELLLRAAAYHTRKERLHPANARRVADPAGLEPAAMRLLPHILPTELRIRMALPAFQPELPMVPGRTASYGLQFVLSRQRVRYVQNRWRAEPDSNRLPPASACGCASDASCPYCRLQGGDIYCLLSTFDSLRSFRRTSMDCR